MAMALIAMAAMMSLVPLMSLLWLLTGILLLLGMAEGVLDVGGNALLVWVHRDSVGPFMNALHFFFGIGAFLSPVIIAQAVLIRGDSSWGYWALALLIIPVAVWLLRLTSPVTEADQDGALTLGRLLAIPIAAALPRQSIQFWQKPSICSIFLTGSCMEVRSAILLPHLQRMAAPAPSQLCLPVLRPQLQIRERHSRSLCVRIG
jgi:hypothetical protein